MIVRLSIALVLLLPGTASMASHAELQANDDLADAVVVTTLPFRDRVWPEDGTMEPEEPEDCLRPNLIGGTVDKVVGNDPAGTVWYRYLGEGEPILVETFLSAPIGIFEITPEGLNLVACSRPLQVGWGSNPHFQLAAFLAREGASYAIQIAKSGTDGVSTLVDISYAITSDLYVEDLTIGGASMDQERPVTMTLGQQPLGAHILVSSCPTYRYPGSFCTTVHEKVIYGSPWPAPGTHSFRWITRGCLGDFTLTATISRGGTYDPDPTNDSDSAEATVIASSPGVGPC